jgi:sugar (pentulose or hexulose) kinase
MHSRVYLTFDIGTSALKTALVAGDGTMVAVDTAEYAFLTPRPGWVEMDPETYWQAAISGTRKVLEQSGVDKSAISAIGFSSQGQTFVPVDASGKPLHDAVVWLDERAGDIAREWESTWLTQDNYRAITGYPLVTPLLTPFKIGWFSRNLPDVGRAWKFLLLPDYMIFRMTGETFTDFTIAQFSGMYNIVLRDWDSAILDAAGVSSDQLSVVLKPGDVAGKLSDKAAMELGLPPGVPVCVGANDQLCGAVGGGNVREGIATETTGTALAVVATTNELADDSGLIVGPHPNGEAFFAMPCAVTAGIVLKWLRDLCHEGESYEDFLSGVGEVAIGCDGLTALPHFGGTGSPDFRSDVRGAFAGLTLGHTRTHLARAVMESCCFVLKELLGLVTRHGVESEIVRSLGGAARSDLWLQMKADVLGTRVERPVCADAASLGAAMLAACGTGEFGSLQEVSENWYKPGKVFEPDAARVEAYGAVYERYLDVQKKICG